jgi:hypothetical protein
MSQTEQIVEEEAVIVPGTEGTDMEGKSVEEIERAMYDQAVEADPDLEVEVKAEPVVEIEEEEKDEKPVEQELGEDGKPVVEQELDEDGKPVVEEELDKDGKPVAKEEKKPTGLEWLDTLSEEDRTKADKFIERSSEVLARSNQRVDSHLGQLQPAQRAITRLTRENRTLREAAEKMRPSVNVEDIIKDHNEKIDKEFSEFPEEATKLKKLFKDSLDGVAEVLETATPAVQQETIVGPDKQEEIQHLATAYSDWGERRFSPELNEWLGKQSQDTVKLINSAYAADNIALLDAFTRDNPDWKPPQKPEDFHSLQQAQHSPLFRGWAEGEGINPDVDVRTIADFQRDTILTRFKTDLGVVISEAEQKADPKVTKLESRRREQLQDRSPGSKRSPIKPGTKLDLDTEAGQRAYYNQLIAADPDIP